MTVSRYRGVSPIYGNRWRAQCSTKHKIYNLGNWRSERTAAWVADFAKYILYGIDPAQWHHLAAKPNFLPSPREISVHGARGDSIVQKLLDKGLIAPELAKARLADYDRVAAAIARATPSE